MLAKFLFWSLRDRLAGPRPLDLVNRAPANMPHTGASSPRPLKYTLQTGSIIFKLCLHRKARRPLSRTASRQHKHGRGTCRPSARQERQQADWKDADPRADCSGAGRTAKVAAAGPCRRCSRSAGTHGLAWLGAAFLPLVQGKLGYNYRVTWYLLYCVLWVSGWRRRRYCAAVHRRWCGEVMCLQCGGVPACAWPAAATPIGHLPHPLLTPAGRLRAHHDWGKHCLHCLPECVWLSAPLRYRAWAAHPSISFPSSPSSPPSPSFPFVSRGAQYDVGVAGGLFSKKSFLQRFYPDFKGRNESPYCQVC